MEEQVEKGSILFLWRKVGMRLSKQWLVVVLLGCHELNPEI